ncbi:MAG: hypothetical protein JNN20_15820 [Betaproteobacteria bacterium]|nr:hypothetical protein [Betaproteobacteria bacterium]
MLRWDFLRFDDLHSEGKRAHFAGISYRQVALLIAALVPFDAYAHGPIFDVWHLVGVIALLFLLIWAFVGTTKAVEGTVIYRLSLGLFSICLSIFILWIDLQVMGSLKPTANDQTFNSIVTLLVCLGTPVILLLMPKIISGIAKHW